MHVCMRNDINTRENYSETIVTLHSPVAANGFDGTGAAVHGDLDERRVELLVVWVQKPRGCNGK